MVKDHGLREKEKENGGRDYQEKRGALSIRAEAKRKNSRSRNCADFKSSGMKERRERTTFNRTELKIAAIWSWALAGISEVRLVPKKSGRCGFLRMNSAS